MSHACRLSAEGSTTPRNSSKVRSSIASCRVGNPRCEWVVSGLCVGCEWVVSGVCVGCEWVVSGLCMGCEWVVSGLCVRCEWVVSGWSG